MDKKIVWIIAKKDIKSILAIKQIWLPMVILPAVLCVLMPSVVVYLLQTDKFSAVNGLGQMLKLIGQIPGEAGETVRSLDNQESQVIYLFVNYMLPSLFLLVPVITSMLIAANSFVGEKEKRTLESLLFSPIAIKDLFIGKMLAAFLPAITLSLGGFLLSAIGINLLTYRQFNGTLFLTVNWLMFVLLIVPSITILTILFNILISARVKGFQEAQQLGGIIVLPVIGLMLSHVSGLFFFSPIIILIIALLIIAGSAVLLWRIAKMNERHILFEKQVH
ncbi:ABC transporter permease subunit [Bacillus capparidis]|uniref:ABC-type Na+ efflux pump permease subunit n=1 Tax=Bacillus capparidis TaxID=1840411 RepID=A0ABS4CW95_9BACI|nr:ABC transporter permease subunit [Bacillus capparidis]MBP1081788.1 ABC-type Na+ efflux pump permease subunit [Bacillus capparidis]MED1096439.1 ABC transporter permease subunit [Bacillus capparidis]